MKTLRERVEHLLELRKLTQAEATRRGNFTNTAFINDILRGHKESVRGVNLERLAKALETSDAFLLGRTDDPEIGEARIVQAAARSPFVPEFDVRAGAAYGGGTDDAEWNIEDASGSSISGHQPVAAWGLPESFVEKELGLKYGFADIIQIRGDSMDDGTAQALVSGDRVIIDRTDKDPRQGGIFAVWDGDGVIVKQVELIRGSDPIQITCKSRNDRYDTIPLVLDGNAHIIGRVAGKISRM